MNETYILNPDTTDEWSWRIIITVEKEDLVCYFVTANIIPSFDVISETSLRTLEGLTVQPLQYDFVHVNSLSRVSRISRTFSSASLSPHPSDLFASRYKSRHRLPCEESQGQHHLTNAAYKLHLGKHHHTRVIVIARAILLILFSSAENYAHGTF